MNSAFPEDYNQNPVCLLEPNRILNSSRDLIFLEESSIRIVSIVQVAIGYLHCVLAISIFLCMHSRYSRLIVRSKFTAIVSTLAVMLGMLGLQLNQVLRLPCGLRIIPVMLLPPLLVAGNTMKLISLYYKSNYYTQLHQEICFTLGVNANKAISITKSRENTGISLSSSRESGNIIHDARLSALQFTPQENLYRSRISNLSISPSSEGGGISSQSTPHESSMGAVALIRMSTLNEANENENKSRGETIFSYESDSNNFTDLLSWKWTERKNIKMTLFMVAPVILAVIINVALDKPLHAQYQCYGCFFTPVQLAIIGLSCLGLIFIALYISRKIPPFFDSFGFFYEIKLSAIFGLVALIGMVMGAVTDDNVTLGQHFSASYVIWFGLQGFLFAFLTLQIIYAFREGPRFKSDQNIKDSRLAVSDTNHFQDLESILETPGLETHPFYLYCMNHFCVENLEFYAAITNWTRVFHSSEQNARRIKAKKIANLFLSRDAPCEINLSYDMSTQVLRTIDDKAVPLTFDLFATVKEECMNVIYGSYLDYVKGL